jgi:hypothetical protein
VKLETNNEYYKNSSQRFSNSTRSNLDRRAISLAAKTACSWLLRAYTWFTFRKCAWKKLCSINWVMFELKKPNWT